MEELNNLSEMSSTLSKLSDNIKLIQDYITLKFGSDFNEFKMKWKRPVEIKLEVDDETEDCDQEQEQVDLDFEDSNSNFIYPENSNDNSDSDFYINEADSGSDFEAEMQPKRRRTCQSGKIIQSQEVDKSSRKLSSNNNQEVPLRSADELQYIKSQKGIRDLIKLEDNLFKMDRSSKLSPFKTEYYKCIHSTKCKSRIVLYADKTFRFTLPHSNHPPPDPIKICQIEMRNYAKDFTSKNPNLPLTEVERKINESLKVKGVDPSTLFPNKDTITRCIRRARKSVLGDADAEKKRPKPVIISSGNANDLEFLVSQRGKEKVKLDGRLYLLEKQRHETGSKYFRCLSNRKGECTSRLTIYPDNTFKQFNSHSDHPLPDPVKIQRRQILAVGKEMAIEDPNMPVSEIMGRMDEIIRQNAVDKAAVLPNTETVKRFIRKAKTASKRSSEEISEPMEIEVVTSGSSQDFNNFVSFVSL